MRFTAHTVCAAIVLSAGATAPLGAQAIDTRNTSPALSYSFSPYSRYLMQTFTAQPGQTSLTSFSFWIGGGANSFNARLYDFSTGSFGPALFTSSTQTGPGGAVQEYNFATPGVTLTAYGYYAAILTDLGGNDPNWVYLATKTVDSYQQGNAYTSIDGNNFYWIGAPDFDFRAEFAATAAPEPSSMALVLTGLIGITARMRRRRR